MFSLARVYTTASINALQRARSATNESSSVVKRSAEALTRRKICLLASALIWHPRAYRRRPRKSICWDAMFSVEASRHSRAAEPSFRCVVKWSAEALTRMRICLLGSALIWHPRAYRRRPRKSIGWDARLRAKPEQQSLRLAVS